MVNSLQHTLVNRKRAMLRISVLCACAIACVVVFTSIAEATPLIRQNVSLTFTSPRTDSSTGIRANLFSMDPGAPGGKPKATTQVQLVFPRGTSFDTRVPARCRASTQGIINGDCPRRSRVGVGTGQANAFPLVNNVALKITAYNVGGGIAFRIQPTVGATFVLRGTINRNTLTVNIPNLIVSGVKVVLTRFTLGIRRITIGGDPYVRTAKRCGSLGNRRVYITTFNFNYDDGSRESLRATSPCVRR